MSELDSSGGEVVRLERGVDRAQRRVSGRELQAARLIALLGQAARGHEDAFADLYDETCARIYGVIVRVIRSQELAEEVTAEVYVEIWRQAARHTPERGGVLAWMIAMAHRRAVDRVRSESEAAPEHHHAQVAATGDGANVREGSRFRIEVARISRALDTLTEVQREALSLSYFGGYTHAQVGKLLGLSSVTTKTRIRDGLIGLRDALGVVAP